MSGTIDLPTLVQKVRVDTRSMNRAEKAAAKFADTTDDLDRSNANAAGSARELDRSLGGLGKTIHDTRTETVGFDDDTRSTGDAMRDLAMTVKGSRVQQEEYEKSVARTRTTMAGFGDDNDRGSRSLLGLASGFKAAGKGAGGLGAFIGNIKFSAIVSIASVAAGALSALSAGAVGLVGQLGPLVGVLGALPAALGALLSAKAVFSSLVKGPADAAKAIQKYGAASEQAKEALKALPPEARKFTLELVKTQNEFKRIQKVGQAAALPNLGKALANFRTLLPIIQKGFVGISKVIGRTGLELSKAVTAGPFKRDLGVIVSNNTKLISTLAKALVPLVTIFKNIVLAAGPMTQTFAEAFLKGSQFLALVTSGPKGQSRLQKFFAQTVGVVWSLSRTLRDFGRGLFNVFSSGAKNGTDFLSSMERLAKKFRDFTESFTGKSKIAKFFQDSKAPIHETALLIGDLFKGFGKLAGNQNIAPLISQIRTDLLPAFLEFADKVGTNIAPTLIKLAEAFLGFQGVLTFSPIVAVANAIASLVISVTNFIDKVPGLNTVVASLLAFSLAVKAVSLAGKFTGVTTLVTALGAVGPAGKAGEKGLAGFIQGIRGADRAGGGKLTFANLIGKGFKGVGAKGKAIGRSFANGISSGAASVRGGAGSILSKITGGLSKVKGAGVSAGKALASGVSTGLKGIAGVGLKAGKGLATGIGAGVKGAGGLLTKGLSGLGSIATGALSKIGPILKGIGAAFKVAAVAARAFALALLANPVFLIIAAIIALGVALFVLWKRSETFRKIVTTAFNAIKAVAVAVFGFIKSYITTVITVIATVIRTYVNIYRTIFTTVFNAIRAVVEAVVGFIAAYIRTYVAIIRRVIQVGLAVVQAVFTRVWGFIKAYVTTTVAVVRAVISRAIGFIREVVQTGLAAVRAVFNTVFRRIPEIVTEQIGRVLSYLGRLGANILRAIGNFASLLWQAGRDLVMGLLNGIRSLATAPIDAIRNIGSNILHGLGSVLGLGSPSRETQRMGGWVSEGLAIGIAKKERMVALSATNLGGSVSEGVAIGLAKKQHLIDRAVKGLGSGLEVATKTKTPLTGVTSGITADVNAQVAEIKRAVVGARDALRSVATTVFSGIRKGVEGAFAGIHSVVSEAFTAIRNIMVAEVGAIRRAVVVGLGGARSAVAVAFNGIESVVAGAFARIRTAVTAEVNAIHVVVVTAFSALRGAVATEVTAIRAVAVAAFAGIRAAITTEVAGIRGVVTTAFAGIRAVVVAVFAGVRAAVTREVTAIGQVVAAGFGSVRAVTAAAFNGVRGVIVGAFAGVSGVVAVEVTAVRRAVIGAFGGIRGSVAAVLSGISAAVVAAFSGARGAVAVEIAGIRRVILDGLGGIRGDVGTAFSGMQSVVAAAFAGVRAAVLTGFGGIQAAAAAGFDGIQGAVNVVAAALAGFITAVTALRRAVAAGLNGVQTQFVTVFGAIRGVVTTTTTAVTGAVTRTLGLVRGLVTTGLAAVRAQFTSVFNAITGIVQAQATRIVNIMRGLGTRILGALGDFRRLLYPVGVDLMKGLVAGMTSFASAPVNALRAIAGNMIGGLRSVLQIGSPSKVTAKVGGFVSAGLAVGITKNRKKVDKAVKGLSEGLAALGTGIGGVPLAKAATNGRGSAGGVTTITYDQRRTTNVEVNETTGPTTLDSLTRRLGAITLLGPTYAAAVTGGPVR